MVCRVEEPQVKMAAKMAENEFWQKVPDHSAYTLRAKTFFEIALSHTVSNINAFLHFT